MSNPIVRRLLLKARFYVHHDGGRIPCDLGAKLMSYGMDVEQLETNLRKEIGL